MAEHCCDVVWCVAANKTMALTINGLQVLLSRLKKLTDGSDLEQRVDLAICLIRSIDLLLVELRMRLSSSLPSLANLPFLLPF